MSNSFHFFGFFGEAFSTTHSHKQFSQSFKSLLSIDASLGLALR